MHNLAAHDATQVGLAHQALDRAAGHIGSLASQQAPHLVGSMDLQVRLPHPFDIGAQHVVAQGACATQLRITLLRGVTQCPDGATCITLQIGAAG